MIECDILKAIEEQKLSSQRVAKSLLTIRNVLGAFNGHIDIGLRQIEEAHSRLMRVQEALDKVTWVPVDGQNIPFIEHEDCVLMPMKVLEYFAYNRITDDGITED